MAELLMVLASHGGTASAQMMLPLMVYVQTTKLLLADFANAGTCHSVQYVRSL